MAEKKKICVVGAGLGGLSAAIRLAGQGHSVDVYEKNTCPGGKAAEINKSGFRFDAGPSLLTMPFVLEELFYDSGEKLNEFVTLKKLETVCRYFYKDGTVINAYSNVDRFADELQNKTKDTASSVLEYLKYCGRIYDLTSELFLRKSFSEANTFLNLKALKTLVNIKNIDAFRSMHEANKSFFKDEKSVQLFDRYATYNGSNPFKTPATLNIIQHVEYNLGAYIPLKGIYSITESLFQLAAKKGVSFYFNSNVEQIIHVNKTVKGIKVNGEEKFYDILVSNSDVKFTYETLLKDTKSKVYKKYKRAESSTSALVFYWGVKGNFYELEIHNILFSENYKKEFEQLFEMNKCPDDPTIYIYISSKYNESDAPAGYENWFVMINAPYNTNQNWVNEINKIRKLIIKRINDYLKIDIEEKIVFEETLSPADIELNTNSTQGSIYGISSNTKFAAFMRQQNKSREYKKLYFCGGSAHPGGGIPLVLLSGKITSELINKYEL